MIATELVDHILSFLHSDEDYTTLKTCSLSFPQIADRHLYSHITFYAPDPTDHLPMTWDQAFYANRTNDKGTYIVDPTQFSHLLIDRPHIANCVRVLRIIASATAAGPAQPTVLLPVISSILSNLSQIESITFSSKKLLSWPTLDPAFCTALENSIRLPSIKQVAVSEINGFPMDMFHSCKNLRGLLLYNQCTAGVGPSTSSYPRLHSLRVDDGPDLSKIVPWMRHNTLHTLSLSIFKYETLPGFWALINACSASLVSLELDHKYGDPPWDETPVFRELRLPLLDHIILRSSVLMPTYESFLPLFASFLASIQTISPLALIRLTLHLQFQRYVHRTEQLVPDWSFIANILVLPIFRHPVEMYIEQVGMDAFGVDVPSSLEEHSDLLRRMLADGKLIIICDEEYNQNVRAR